MRFFFRRVVFHSFHLVTICSQQQTTSVGRRGLPFPAPSLPLLLLLLLPLPVPVPLPLPAENRKQKEKLRGGGEEIKHLSIHPSIHLKPVFPPFICADQDKGGRKKPIEDADREGRSHLGGGIHLSDHAEEPAETPLLLKKRSRRPPLVPTSLAWPPCSTPAAGEAEAAAAGEPQGGARRSRRSS